MAPTIKMAAENISKHNVLNQSYDLTKKEKQPRNYSLESMIFVVLFVTRFLVK